uniref:GRAM domain containing 1A n=1 Tax=Oncorhynchus mykiss TaxID=8022 RepID=A0A8K9X035_ONCMY
MLLMGSCEKVDFNIAPRTVARLVFEAEQDNRNGGNSSNGSTASNSPRSTPGSSPSLRRRVLGGSGGGGSRTSDVEGGPGERSGERRGSDSPLPSAAASAYPVASRHFSRNAKKMQSWYNVLSPTYKQRNEDFRKLFKKLPDTERLIVDYSCALQKDILLQGRLYLSENWLCFYSNIFRWETTITILLKDVTTLTKEKTAKVIPNAIQISTDHDKHFFTSFGARDRSYMMMFRLWQNALMDKPLSPKELWHIVHQCYGTELGLTSEDDDYVSPTDEHINGLLPVEESVSVSDLLDLSSLGAIASLGSSPPSMAALFPSGPLLASGGLGSCPPSSTCLPVDIPGSPSLDPPDPSPPSSQSSLPSTTHTASLSAPASAAASFYVEEDGDFLLESANHMMPPSATSLGNLSSLDQLTNDDELPTDPSNSSDTQEEDEVESFCADLAGRLHINMVVRMSVDKLHDLLFSADTHFIQHLFSQRHFTDLSVREWQQDSCSGNTNRILSYTIAINNPLGPKTAPVVETQTLFKNSAPGECYVVDSEVITSGIPYQDYFYTVHRYCLTAINKNKSRLRVSSDICYKKQPWSLVKALIEKNTWSGIEEYYRHMGETDLHCSLILLLGIKKCLCSYCLPLFLVLSGYVSVSPSLSPPLCLPLSVSPSLSPPLCLPLSVSPSLSPPLCLPLSVSPFLSPPFCLPLSVSPFLSPPFCLPLSVSPFCHPLSVSPSLCFSVAISLSLPPYQRVRCVSWRPCSSLRCQW